MKKISAIICCLFAYFWAVGQVEEKYELPENIRPKHIDFSMSCPSGETILRTTQNSSPITISGLIKPEEITTSFDYAATKNGAYNVSLKVKEDRKRNLKSLKSGHRKDTWQVFLNHSTSFGLDLNYGWGKSFLDLSNISISDLNLHTGHAEVNVNYAPNAFNPVEMNSFNAMVDVGSLTITNLDYSKAANFSAEVGVGNLFLAFSDKAISDMKINVNLGAGKCKINLPTQETAIKIKNNGDVKAPKGFHPVNGYYVNQAFLMGDFKHTLIFDIQVSLGSVYFE